MSRRARHAGRRAVSPLLAAIPLLPRYKFLVREDGTRIASFYPVNSNYLQNVEGAVDTAHFPYLHTNHWSKVKQRLFSQPGGSSRTEAGFLDPAQSCPPDHPLEKRLRQVRMLADEIRVCGGDAVVARRIEGGKVR